MAVGAYRVPILLSLSRPLQQLADVSSELATLVVELEQGYLCNSLLGDGRLGTTKPPSPKAGRDTFVYDPMRPVPSLGGSICTFRAKSAVDPGPQFLPRIRLESLGRHD